MEGNGLNFSPLVYEGCCHGGGVLPGKLGVGVRQASENPSAIKTNIGDFPYAFYDLTKNLIPCLLCFRPALQLVL